ncbi:hypothetical protein HYE82_31760 [Streptomyces sp. BR123]|uniref:effector-associated constant component EACC1 n=1 Tax=Streptomyces sp. BR123 TaxID=2749828 RepID=UPI0015C4BC4D|nr:hypothetical protein [Streptomyces sp. BR123]NXY98878.1 hypothetical protein [Streptomyces sp. BR123]
MRVDLHVQGDRADVRSLYQWLSRDPVLRRTARIELAGQDPRPGDMGDVLDLVTLIVGSGWSAASLGVAVAAWRGTRPNPPVVTVRRGDLEVVLAGADEAQLRQAVALLDRPAAAPAGVEEAVSAGATVTVRGDEAAEADGVGTAGGFGATGGPGA